MGRTSVDLGGFHEMSCQLAGGRRLLWLLLAASDLALLGRRPRNATCSQANRRRARRATWHQSKGWHPVRACLARSERKVRSQARFPVACGPSLSHRAPRTAHSGKARPVPSLASMPRNMDTQDPIARDTGTSRHGYRITVRETNLPFPHTSSAWRHQSYHSAPPTHLPSVALTSSPWDTRVARTTTTKSPTRSPTLSTTTTPTPRITLPVRLPSQCHRQEVRPLPGHQGRHRANRATHNTCAGHFGPRPAHHLSSRTTRLSMSLARRVGDATRHQKPLQKTSWRVSQSPALGAARPALHHLQRSSLHQPEDTACDILSMAASYKRCPWAAEWICFPTLRATAWQNS